MSNAANVFDEAANEYPRVAINRLRALVTMIERTARSLGQAEACGMLPDTARAYEAELSEFRKSTLSEIDFIAKWIGIEK